jgi:small subunit ribosomal protein S16
MPAAIKLMRTGKKGMPSYRIIVIDKRKKRESNYIDKIGNYNPLTNPAQINLDKIKLDSWIKKGAIISDGVKKLLKQVK